MTQDTLTVLRAALEEAYKHGWVEAARWANRYDLWADIDSPAYIADRSRHMDSVIAAMEKSEQSAKELEALALPGWTITACDFCGSEGARAYSNPAQPVEQPSEVDRLRADLVKAEAFTRAIWHENERLRAATHAQPVEQPLSDTIEVFYQEGDAPCWEFNEIWFESAEQAIRSKQA